MKRNVTQIEFLVADSADLRGSLLQSMQIGESQKKIRQLLVFINPFGGAGAATTNWAIARRLFDFASSRV